MKRVYKFFGQLCEIHGFAKLEKFGQTIELDADLARDVALGGGAILPAGEFDQIFAGEDLTSGRRGKSDAFALKYNRALDAHRAWLEELAAPVQQPNLFTATAEPAENEEGK